MRAPEAFGGEYAMSFGVANVFIIASRKTDKGGKYNRMSVA